MRKWTNQEPDFFSLVYFIEYSFHDELGIIRQYEKIGSITVVISVDVLLA